MKNGAYELVIAPDNYPGKRYRDRYCYEHTLVHWQNTGVLPASDELIHHCNGDRRDNVFENLELLKKGKHSSDHNSNRSAETRKKLSLPGSKNGNAKLNDVIVKEIRRRLLESKGKGVRALGREYGVSHAVISDVYTGKIWKHI